MADTYYDLTQTGAQVQTILDNALDADHVVYDNTNSGLAATDVQAAIDEIASGAGSMAASSVSYDNTNSGLVATDVQDAIDELASSSGVTIFSSLTASSWSADATYTDYPYKCTLTCAGVTSNDVATVIFDVDEATSNAYAPVSNTVADGVEIWSSRQTSITVPTVLVVGG